MMEGRGMKAMHGVCDRERGRCTRHCHCFMGFELENAFYMLMREIRG